MKKIAAIVLCVLLVASMAIVGVSAASTVSVGSGDGTLNVYKNIAQGNTTGGLEGAGFTVYKVMSYNGTAPDAYFSFVEPYASNSSVTTYAGNNLTLINGQTNRYVTYGDTDDLEGLISTLEGITNTTTASSEATTDSDGKASFTDLDKGVYLVKETTIPDGYSASSQSFLVAILDDDQVVNSYPKNQKMDVDKNILTDTQYTAALSAPTADTGSDSTSLSVGDTVNYQIQSKVPNYDNRAIEQMASTEGVNVVKFTDTLSNGLTFSAANLEAMKVFAGSNDITASVTKTRTDDQHFTVEVPLDAVYSTANNVNYLGQNLYVVYQATVNANAVVTNGNNNTVRLEYKNNPSDSAYDLDPVDIPPEDVPVVYTYQMNVTKLLDGVAVTGTPSVANLRFVLKQGNNNVSASGSNGVYTVTSDHAASATEMSLKSTDGTLQVKGLSAGTYTLTESGSVTGYTILQSPLTIVVSDAGNGVVSAKINNTGDELMVQANNPAYDANKKAAIEAFMEGKDGDFADYDDTTPGYPTEAADYDPATPEKLGTGVFAFEINNPSSQFDLPTTGGMGILLFTLGGAVVLAAAIVIFTLARKKKDTK